MFESDSLTEHQSGAAATGSADEQKRLEDAMRRADELLVTSLKFDERRRARRKVLLLFSLGGLTMFVTICALLLGLALNGDAAAADPEKAVKLTEEGWISWQAQKFGAAAEKFREAVKADPTSSAAWNGLGWANFNGGNYRPAEDAFNKVLELEPTHPAALNGLGQLYLVRGKFDQAEKYLLKAAPNAPASWYGLAKVYLIQGNFADAERWAKKVVDSGQGDDFARQMLQAAKDKKVSPELRQMLGPAPVAPEAPKSGKASSDESASDKAEQLAMEGWDLWKARDLDAAADKFQKAVRLDPKNPNAWNGLGWAASQSGKTQRADDAFRKAILLQPNHGAALNGLGQMLLSQRKYEEAKEYLLKAAPTAPAAWYGLAKLYLLQEDFADAETWAQKIVDSGQADDYAKQMLQAAKDKKVSDELRRMIEPSQASLGPKD